MFKTTATKNPVVGVSVAAHAAEQEKLWKDLEAAFAETASVIRTYTGEAKSATAAGGAAHRATALQWYTKIYATVTRSPAAAEFVYSRFCRFVEADLKANVTAPIMQMYREMYREASSTNRSQATASSDLLMFTTIGKHYEHFCVFRKYSHLVLGYLDSHYTQRNMKLSINHLMNSFFFHVVYVNVRDALATVVLAQIKKYRDGESVPMQALQNAIRMFSEIATTTDANAAQSPSGMLTARDQQVADKPEPALP
ncbi:cullin, putative [Bodo saltans]|uniref:Cullin, putative n=1 Tax=Bodo saltans TaxID=75058 RepID=A0A0S4JBP8_BODSA|nr:cullin, putative [Bodo saltans]|eukprot:CUG88952.1 cullin, putative [Bodo saltans]